MDRRSFLGLSAGVGAAMSSPGFGNFPMFLGRKKGPTPPVDAPTELMVIFRDNFVSGDFTRWGACQWKTSGVVRNDNCQSYDGVSDYSATVADGGPGHELAARFEVRDGDAPISSGERAESAGAEGTVSALVARVSIGDERVMEWDMKFDSSFPVNIGDYMIPWQWHSELPAASPPLCLDILNDDIIYVANNEAPDNWRIAVQSMVRNQWQHWKILAKFHTDPAQGYVEVWVDGALKVARTNRQTIVDGDTGAGPLRNGIYRDDANTATAILWHDNVVIMDPAAPITPALVQSAVEWGATSSTTITATLPVGATAGNVIMCGVGADKSTGAVTPPAGFTTIVSDDSTSVGIWVGYKISTGGETAATFTRTNTSVSGDSMWIGEYSQSGSGTWTIVGSASDLTTEATRTVTPSGTTSATSAAGRGLAFFAIDSGGPAGGTASFTNNYLHIQEGDESGSRAGLSVATKDYVAQGTAATTTQTHAPSADQTSGAIVVFARV